MKKNYFKCNIILGVIFLSFYLAKNALAQEPNYLYKIMYMAYSPKYDVYGFSAIHSGKIVGFTDLNWLREKAKKEAIDVCREAANLTDQDDFRHCSTTVEGYSTVVEGYVNYALQYSDSNTYERCVALATDQNGSWAMYPGADRESAKKRAITNCGTWDCKVRVSHCIKI